MQIALKVDVDTYRGTLEGVPRLLDLFAEFRVPATFLFSVGPDHTGRALRRVFRRGFLSKVRRTSVTSHYGLRTLMYGVLLPGPHIGRRAGEPMRRALARGHEVGIHCYDHVRWQDFVARRDEAWTRKEMQRAHEAFVDALRVEPATIGAAGWQLNRHVLALEETMGFTYASDVRGRAPFFPTMEGIASRCMQIPTTLPTLDELVGLDGITEENADEAVARAVYEDPARDHVYTLHAELEGMALLPVMRRLLERWRGEGYPLVSLGDVYRSLDAASIPQRAVMWSSVAGRSGLLACEDDRAPAAGQTG